MLQQKMNKLSTEEKKKSESCIRKEQSLAQNILQELQKKTSWKSFLKNECRRNGVDTKITTNFTILKMRRFLQGLSRVEEEYKERAKSPCWIENQLKAYQWMLIAFSSVQGVLIELFNSDQWEPLSKIFRSKSINILQYEAVKFIKGDVKKPWTEEETLFLVSIIQTSLEFNKWNDVARKLFQSSESRYFRSGKQCRQRWLNHHDPLKRHGNWTLEEDISIVKFIQKKGRKWSEIARSLDRHRTQHMVKNRFKTILIKQKKLFPGVRSQKQILRKFLQQNQTKKIEFVRQSKQQFQQAYEQKYKLQQEAQESENDEINDEIAQNPNKFWLDMPQLISPGVPLLYQTFTPNFLNTPHSRSMFISCSFDFNETSQNLFLK